jgi:hypothetical protein
MIYRDAIYFYIEVSETAYHIQCETPRVLLDQREFAIKMKMICYCGAK